MKRTAKSFGHAISGLIHAVSAERNLQLFCLAHIPIVAAGLWLGLAIPEWILVVMFGGGFMIVELLNTALERLADTFDDCEKKHRGGHYHHGVKQTKDVAAAASLIALILDLSILALLFVPRIIMIMILR